jgi:hypothetical protein
MAGERGVLFTGKASQGSNQDDMIPWVLNLPARINGLLYGRKIGYTASGRC